SQADLDALQRVGDGGLSAIATNGAADIVDQILGVTSVRGATLVGDGPMTGPAVELLSAQGPTVAIGAANVAAQDSATGGPPPAGIGEANAVPPQDVAPLLAGVLGNPRGRFDDGVVAGIEASTGRLWRLTSALTADERTALTGAQYTAPLREDMLRALSQSV